MDEDAPVKQSRAAFVTRFFNQVDHYKRLLFRYWWIPFLTFGASVWIQWTLVKRDQPSWVSVGRMIVNVKVSIPEANMFTEDINNFLGTQVALMESDSIISRVNAHLQAKNPELHPAPVQISVGLLPKSSIFNLRAAGGDPYYTQAYLEATMEEYINLKKDLFATASSATQSSMEEKLKQIGVELKKSKDELSNYAATNDVVTQPNGENPDALYLATLTQRLAQDRSDLELLRALNASNDLESQPAKPEEPAFGPLPGADPVPTHDADPLKNQLPSNLGNFEAAYQQADEELIISKANRDRLQKAGLGADSELLIKANEEIEHWEMRLDIIKEKSREKLKDEQRVLEQKIQNLEKQVKEWEKKSQDTSKKLAPFEALKENEKRLQARYDQMQANLQTLDVDKGLGQESVTILDPATPAVSVPPNKAKHLIMAGLTGLFLGIGIVVFRDRLDDRPRSFTELEQLFDMPVLGQFPLMKKKSRRLGAPILQLDDDRYPLIEAYRSFRSALLYKDLAEDRPKSIVITSANPGDGKSMVSANFAITLAQAGARVLLVDADLRRGVMHKHFAIASSPGLAEVLAGDCAWSKAVVPTSIRNLSVLPRGASPRHSENLFATAGKFLTDLAGQYDYYLFDTAPVMVGDDVLSLAPHVDGLIMVVRSGYTSGRVAQAALDLLNLRRVKVIGLVFNAVHPKSSDFYHYRFKEYYAQHPKA